MQLERIQTEIYEIRSQKVMLDFDLAELYEIETNLKRVPADFMLQISEPEWKILRLQIETSKVCHHKL